MSKTWVSCRLPGVGSEIIGALRAGWDEIVGIDLEESYLEIAKARIDHYLKGAA